MPLHAERLAEIETLAACYGEPIRQTITLQGNSFNPLAKRSRYGEVCMVVRRPDGTLILARKTFYPPNAHRLLTGGIDDGETIEDALIRETKEETGLDFEVRRFLAYITYHVAAANSFDHIARDFFTFAFLVDETGGVLEPQDEHEKIDDFRFVLPEELPTIVQNLTTLRGADTEIDSPNGVGITQQWGAFRAVVHRAVHQALCGSSAEHPLPHEQQSSIA